jgi:predicted outer membrane repeat protein
MRRNLKEGCFAYAGRAAHQDGGSLPLAHPAHHLLYHLSLRAAIMQANYIAGADTIILPAGTYQLTRVGHDFGGLTGSLMINDDVTIQGAGSAVTIIDGNGAVIGDRVFWVQPAVKNVSLSGLTILNGAAPSGNLKGGGLEWESSPTDLPLATLALSDVILEKNSAQYGGGLYMLGGQITMTNTQIRSNTATSLGRGAYIDSSGLTFQDSKAYSNTAVGAGAFYLSTIANGHITRSEFYANSASAGSGGALQIASDGTRPGSLVTIQDSSLHNNNAYFGGAIDTSAPLYILRTTLNQNTSTYYGGGLNVYDAPTPSTHISIVQSTFSGNFSQYGGGIYYNDLNGDTSTITVQDSTISGNGVSHEGGAIYASGSANLTLVSATIAENVIYKNIKQPTPTLGGGLFISSPAIISSENTLISGDYFTDGATLPTPDDCYGALSSNGHNLIQTTTNCAIGGTTTGNITGQDPLLGPLQNNGGPTLTRALLGTSPAIDAGDNALCSATDQRGIPRPVNGGISLTCDIGAFEFLPFNEFLLMILH